MDRIPGADTLGFGFDITKRYHESSTTQRIFKEGKGKDTTMTLGKTTYAVPENIGAEPIRDKADHRRFLISSQIAKPHFLCIAAGLGIGMAVSRIAGRYELKEQLGEGGMGIVCRVLESQLQPQVEGAAQHVVRR